MLGDGAAQARRKRDQTLAVLREQIVIDAWLVVEPFKKAGGNQFDQVAIALGILAEQNKVIVAALTGLRLGISVPVRGIEL